MVYKNGFKEYSIAFCIFGIIYGLIHGLFHWDIMRGIIVGLISATIFTISAVLNSKRIEKKVALIRLEISKAGKIICEGPANNKKAIVAIGGWLFVSQDTIEFYPNKKNKKRQNVTIIIDDIVSIKTKLNQLKIYVKEDKTYTFVVNKANLWKQAIMEIL